MSGHKDVVVGYDGSQHGRAALAWACDEASRRGLGLRVVHVAAPWAARESTDARVARVHRWMREEAERTLNDACAKARTWLGDREMSSAVLHGEPAQMLLQEAEHAALLVMGSRGLGGFSGLLLGSVALHVTAHAPCPVVVVRHTGGGSTRQGGEDDAAAERPAAEFGEVVVGTDDSPEARAAVRFAVTEAAARGARLRVLRAWTTSVAVPPRDRSGGVEEQGLTAEERALAESLADVRASYPDVEIVSEVVRGRAGSVLVAASSSADLVVVGSRGRSALRGLVLGSVSHALVQHANCPVAVVRRARDSE